MLDWAMILTSTQENWVGEKIPGACEFTPVKLRFTLVCSRAGGSDGLAELGMTTEPSTLMGAETGDGSGWFRLQYL